MRRCPILPCMVHTLTAAHWLAAAAHPPPHGAAAAQHCARRERRRCSGRQHPRRSWRRRCAAGGAGPAGSAVQGWWASASVSQELSASSLRDTDGVWTMSGNMLPSGVMRPWLASQLHPHSHLIPLLFHIRKSLCPQGARRAGMPPPGWQVAVCARPRQRRAPPGACEAGGRQRPEGRA